MASPGPAASEARVISLIARRGDADGDGRVSAADLARFAELPEDELIGLDAWRFIDPNLLRPLPGTTVTPDDQPSILPTGEPERKGSGTSSDGGTVTFRTAGTGAQGSALSLIDAAQTDSDGRGNQLLYLRYTMPVPLCLVPEDATDDPGAAARAARAGLCFDGLPADLADVDQLWRLNGITKVSPDATEIMERVEDGPVCLIGAAPEGAEVGDLYRLTPLPKDVDPADDAMPVQHRMCFDELDGDMPTLPVEAEATSDPQEDAALHVALDSGPTAFTALALMSAAVAARPTTARSGSNRKGARHAMLLSELNESGEG